MHPVLTMRAWGHAHHIGNRHELGEWFSKSLHDSQVWVVVALILYLFTVISLVLLVGQDTPPTVVSPMYPFYHF